MLGLVYVLEGHYAVLMSVRLIITFFLLSYSRVFQLIRIELGKILIKMQTVYKNGERSVLNLKLLCD